MESYIPVSYINDFLYAPESIYLHMLYDDFADYIYKDTPQINGLINHKSIDNAAYSSHKDILQGTMFYCDKYSLCGKIDIFDTKNGILVERKSKIKTLHLGYKYQLYAQYFGLLELGYTINKLALHSLEDNKRYDVALPAGEELADFEQLIDQIKNYNPLSMLESTHLSDNANNSIYGELGF